MLRQNFGGPISTNKFYAGFFLGGQTTSTFTHPYSVSWSRGAGNAASMGLAISHIEANMIASGDTNASIPGNPVRYYLNPIGIQSMLLSAAELGPSTTLSTQNLSPFAAQVVLQPTPGARQNISFPVVQGMGFVTGVYSNMQPLVQSGVMFRNFAPAGSPHNGMLKYRVTLENNETWLIYVVTTGGNGALQFVSPTTIQGSPGFSGFIQVAKNPAGALGEKLYDNSSGVYAIDGTVNGSVSSNTGTYSLSWTKVGVNARNTPLLMFALPHHVESFDGETAGRKTSIQLRTTTKGMGTAVIGEYWTMTEPNLPVSMDFGPWSDAEGKSVVPLSSTAQRQILAVAPTELNQDIASQSNLNSMYFSGKALSKFAVLIYTVSKLGGNPGIAQPALDSLKSAFATFVNNKQQVPLVYDNVWKGAVSSASYDGGSPGEDFGNTFYNDHHFHYGYFIHTAAIIGALDPSWIPANRDWVNMLVRDAGNAAKDDPYFPFSRGFDWFNGHSWAKGLFESGDGKDQESTSEDSMFAYALKMWGNTIGDRSMEMRGNLMLGILKRSFHNYFLMESDNVNQPANFVPNKATGIVSFFPLHLQLFAF